MLWTEATIRTEIYGDAVLKVIERIAYSLIRQLVTGVPLENLYADDIVIIADSMGKCVVHC